MFTQPEIIIVCSTKCFDRPNDAVNYEQDLEPLKTFAQEHGIALAIQQIQPKKSYQAHYRTEPLPYKTFQYSYLENDKKNVSSCCTQCGELIGIERLYI